MQEKEFVSCCKKSTKLSRLKESPRDENQSYAL